MNRTTRALHLTSEGEAYFARARTILGDLDDLEEFVAARQVKSLPMNVETSAAALP